MKLPALREDLDLMPGPNLADGQPSWTLHDPARNLFFRIDWPTFEVMQRWSLDNEEAIAQDISRHTTLQMRGEDVRAVVEFLKRHQVLKPDASSARQMAERVQAMQGSWLKWLLHHYLFFRVPLVKPDAWLAGWLPIAALFGSRMMVRLTAIVFAIGLFQVVRQWDAFAAQLVDIFSLEGLAAYAVALVCVKALHELGHASRVRHSCRIFEQLSPPELR